MSQRLISHSPDLKRLQDEGYDIEVRSGHLVAKGVPYLASHTDVKYGVLVTKLTLAGNITSKPDDHVMYFCGAYPCQHDGAPIAKIQHASNRTELIPDLFVDHSFSAKPVGDGYADYYEKVTNYIAILSGPVQAVDPDATARTFPVIEAKEEESVFKYVDTASSRAEIVTAVKKLEINKIAIVGLGGTGAYVLDLVAKTPVKEIHLFDGDIFLQHNAFRCPGAPSTDDLKQKLTKTVHFERLYSNMRWGIFSHPYFIDATNVDQLDGFDFVFLCLDKGSARRVIAEKLEGLGIPYIDVGMGVYMTEAALGGIVRTTTSTRTKRDHLRARISFSDDGGNNEYSRNIQIADLNALNAALAVIKWKKLFGFYLDFDREHHSTYTIDGNALTNEDKE